MCTQLGHAVNASFEAAALKGKAPTIDQLADSLRCQNYDVRVRTGLGGGATLECLRNLRHSFLTLILTGDPVMLSMFFPCRYTDQSWQLLLEVDKEAVLHHHVYHMNQLYW